MSLKHKNSSLDPVSSCTDVCSLKIYGCVPRWALRVRRHLRLAPDGQKETAGASRIQCGKRWHVQRQNPYPGRDALV